MLLINAGLTNPPSLISAFKQLTRYANCFLEVTVLLELDCRDVKLYYPWLRNKGAMEYVRGFVEPGIVDGIRIDIEERFIDTVYVTDRITQNNLPDIIQAVSLELFTY